jgi:hypothetical protein
MVWLTTDGPGGGVVAIAVVFAVRSSSVKNMTS